MPIRCVTPVEPAEHDLANRLPVWVALSDLYLDTELSAHDFERLAETLAASPYTTGELEQILLAEVHPACFANLLSVAGVWSGFDPCWLRQRILGRQRAWLRWPVRLLPFRSAMGSEAADLFILVADLRDQGVSDGPTREALRPVQGRQ